MITKTKTGRIHYAERGLYSGEIAEMGEALPTPVKRGRGRPSKNVGPSGAVYNCAPLAQIIGKRQTITAAELV